jgi:predicted RNase H-like HicB family nuclease
MVQHIKKAVQNAELVIQEWMEMARKLGRPIPEPKGRLMFA